MTFAVAPARSMKVGWRRQVECASKKNTRRNRVFFFGVPLAAGYRAASRTAEIDGVVLFAAR